MEGRLVSLYQAELVEGPSGPRERVSGTLGVFAYGGAGGVGELCLFVPDDPDLLGGKPKLRPGPGGARKESARLLLAVEKTGVSYAWEIVRPLTDPDREQAFLAYAEAQDRIIRHLLAGARLLDG